jgi:transcriptional regulator with XRE-family HTH domain
LVESGNCQVYNKIKIRGMKKMAFSDNLQYLRRKNKITQEELADEISVTRQSVSKWETGEAYPDTDKLILLCEKFNLTMDELLRGNVAEKDNSNYNDAVSEDLSELTCCGGEDKLSNFCCTAKKRRYLCTAINIAIMLCAVAVFITCGFADNLWYISWVAFIYGAGLSAGLNGIVLLICYNVKRSKMVLQAVAGAINGFVMLTCTAVYLTIGMAINIWHPTWIIFVIGAVICATVDAICNTCVSKK